MDWFADNAVAGVARGLALILAAIEAATVDFVFLMLAGGALGRRRGGRARGAVPGAGRRRRRRGRCCCSSLVRPVIKRQFMVAEAEPRHRRAAGSSAAAAACSGRHRRPTAASRWAARPGPPAPPQGRRPRASPAKEVRVVSPSRRGHRDRHRPSRPDRVTDTHRTVRPGADRHPWSRPTLVIVLLILVAFALIVLVRTVRIVPAADRADHRAAGPLRRTLERRHPLPRAVRRQGARQHRPARAGRVLPAAAGDHLATTSSSASTRSSTTRSSTRSRPSTRSPTSSRASSSSPSPPCATSSARSTSSRR